MTTYRGFEIKIIQDDEPQDPRQDDGNIGKIYCWHPRYNIGDKHGFKRPGDLYKHICEGEANGERFWRLPVYLYDHSGLHLSTESFRGRLPQGHAEFDSCQIGWIYISEANYRDTLGITGEINEGFEHKVLRGEEDPRAVYSILRREVETLNDYVNGNVWGYTIEPLNRENKISIDAGCWGFFGDEGIESAIAEAKSEIDYAINNYKTRELQKQADKKAVDWLINSCYAL